MKKKSVPKLKFELRHIVRLLNKSKRLVDFWLNSLKILQSIGFLNEFFEDKGGQVDAKEVVVDDRLWFKKNKVLWPTLNR